MDESAVAPELGCVVLAPHGAQPRASAAHQATLPGPTDVLELDSALKCLTRWEPPNIWLFPSVKWGSEQTWVLDGESLVSTHIQEGTGSRVTCSALLSSLSISSRKASSP